MPYIKEDRRLRLDDCISEMVNCLDGGRYNTDSLEEILGDINYTFSRILTGLMGQPSYNKIAMITGVLENIKQEHYRRVASPYEDKKIVQNGDIKEYKNVS
jgi:hypothetical protein